MVKGSSGALTAAVAGTDYLLPTGSAAGLTNFPTLNQNTSGTAGGLSSTLAVGSGGTGATTLTGYIKGTGTTAMTASTTIPGTDISGNITGNAANVTGIVAIANGGTGSATQNFVDLTTTQTAAGAKTWSGLGTFNSGISVSGKITTVAPASGTIAATDGASNACTFATGSNDIAGIVTTGNSNSTQLTITFASAYLSAPVAVVAPSNSSARGGGAFSVSTTTTSMTIRWNTNATNAGWNYIVLAK